MTGLVKDLITPLIGAIGGKPNFSGLTFTINKSKFFYGDFLNLLITFAIVVAVMYFLVVVPFSKLLDRFKPPPTSGPGHRLPALPILDPGRSDRLLLLHPRRRHHQCPARRRLTTNLRRPGNASTNQTIEQPRPTSARLLDVSHATPPLTAGSVCEQSQGSAAPAQLRTPSAAQLLSPIPRRACTVTVARAEWARGAAWAFEQAVGLVWYYATTNPVMSELGRCSLSRIADDAPQEDLIYAPWPMCRSQDTPRAIPHKPKPERPSEIHPNGRPTWSRNSVRLMSNRYLIDTRRRGSWIST